MTEFYKQKYTRNEVHLVASAYKRQHILLWPKSHPDNKKFTYWINGIQIQLISNLGNFKYLILLKSGVFIVLNDSDHLALKQDIYLDYKNQQFFHFTGSKQWDVYSEHGQMR